MKILIIIIVFAMMLLSCNDREAEMPKEITRWIVTDIKLYPNNLSTYHVEPFNTKQLNTSATWLMDSTRKYAVGDTLVFTLN